VTVCTGIEPLHPALAGVSAATTHDLRDGSWMARLKAGWVTWQRSAARVNFIGAQRARK
jgi:hypothetical protein